jgi:phospholipase C
MPNGSQPADPIQRVVVMMFENRSFDHMLGCCQKVHSGLDGIPEGTPRMNSDGAMAYPQGSRCGSHAGEQPQARARKCAGRTADHNSGFVRDYAHEYPSSSPAQRAEVMKCHDLDTLPALHKLARYFFGMRSVIRVCPRTDVAEPTLRDERDVGGAGQNAFWDHES